jgi:hypothetical protein
MPPSYVIVIPVTNAVSFCAYASSMRMVSQSSVAGLLRFVTLYTFDRLYFSNGHAATASPFSDATQGFFTDFVFPESPAV